MPERYTDADVQLVAEAIRSEGLFYDDERDAARAVLDALTAAGRLMPAGSGREWGVVMGPGQWPPYLEDDEAEARAFAAEREERRVVSRLVGPWEPDEEPEQPPPPGAGVCAKCGEWDADPARFTRCPTCGQPWSRIAEPERLSAEGIASALAVVDAPYRPDTPIEYLDEEPEHGRSITEEQLRTVDEPGFRQESLGEWPPDVATAYLNPHTGRWEPDSTTTVEPVRLAEEARIADPDRPTDDTIAQDDPEPRGGW